MQPPRTPGAGGLVLTLVGLALVTALGSARAQQQAGPGPFPVLPSATGAAAPASNQSAAAQAAAAGAPAPELDPTHAHAHDHAPDHGHEGEGGSKGHHSNLNVVLLNKCPTGGRLRVQDVKVLQKGFYATIVQRFGASSNQTKAFVPRPERADARRRAAALPALGPELKSVDASLEALTAMDLPGGGAAAGGGGGLRRLRQVGQPQPPPKQPYTPVVIDTYVWQIRSTDGDGDYSWEAAAAQVDLLNNAYRVHGFRFNFVGVWYYIDDSFFRASDTSLAVSTMKQTLRRGTARVLNVWTNKPSTAYGELLGFATFPWDQAASPSDDGVIISYSTIPGADPSHGWNPYGAGATLIHEVGHWLGLYHTFQGGCSDTAGDYVPDTPAEATATDGCPKASWPDTCPYLPGWDPITNYMDYSYDSCMDSFTAGQGTRMRAHWAAYRYNK